MLVTVLIVASFVAVPVGVASIIRWWTDGIPPWKDDEGALAAWPFGVPFAFIVVFALAWTVRAA